MGSSEAAFGRLFDFQDQVWVQRCSREERACQRKCERHRPRQETAVPVTAHLAECKASVRGMRDDVHAGRITFDVLDRRKEPLVATVESRAASHRPMPEIDRKRSIGAVDEDTAAESSHPKQLCDIRPTQLVAVREGLHAIPRTPFLRDPDVLDHSRRHHEIERSVGKRQLQPARNGQAIAMLALPPLPLSER
jgi:hypothetical protein